MSETVFSASNDLQNQLDARNFITMQEIAYKLQQLETDGYKIAVIDDPENYGIIFRNSKRGLKTTDIWIGK